MILILLVLIQSTNILVATPKYKIGYSQCTTNDLWRQTQIRLMEIELSFYPDMELVVKDAHDDTNTQIKQIEELVHDGIDLLIVSPNESEPISPIVEKVYDSGIPVIVIDRKVNTNHYSSYIGGDNYMIGVKAGNYAARLLNGRGKILEIRGLEGSSPSKDRHEGFKSAIDKYPEVEIVESVSGDWKAESANSILNNTFLKGVNFDLVFAHNDVMAREARKFIQQFIPNKYVYVMGVDGLPGINGGIQMVVNNILDATFMYQTGGGLAIQTANDILNGHKVLKQNIIPTITIDPSNAAMLKIQTDQIELLHSKIERQKLLLTIESNRNKTQRTVLFLLISILTLTLALIMMIYLTLNHKKKANKLLIDKNKKIEKQNELLKEQHEKLKQIDEELKEATQAKLKFFTNISHEFKTPLTLIKGPIENLLDQANNDPASVRKMYEVMYKNTHRLLQMINQLMDFSLLENKKLNIKTSQYNLVDFLTEICDSFKPMAENKKIDLSVNFPSEKTEIWFDYEKIEKVMFNLLSNSFKFTPKNGKISINLSRKDVEQNGLFSEEICIEVKDNGPGISAEELPKIFDRYYFKGNSNNVKNSGIGLHFSKELVELHRGRIEIESTEGEGTSVFVYLPVGNVHLFEEEMIQQQNATNIIKNNGVVLNGHNLIANNHQNQNHEKNTPTVLIIEDTQDMLDYIRVELNGAYNIITAENGNVGIEQALKEEPDLIISDVMMPEMDGFEMTRQLKSDTKTSHIPIILLTARTSERDKIEGIDGGADFYIEKPFNAEFLRSSINNLLISRQKLRKHYRQTLDFKLPGNEINNLDKKFLSKLKYKIIESIGTENLNVDELATELGMSRVHLYRKVKKLTDMSVSEFVISVKLKRSLEYLGTSGKTITEIAYESGFSSQSYYTRCFKEQFKMSPRQFIKQNQAS